MGKPTQTGIPPAKGCVLKIMNKLYAIVMITGDEGTLGFGIEPVGIYSSMELAFEYVEKLEKEAPNMDGEYMFDIFEYRIDEEPLILEFFRAQKRIQTRDTEIMENLLIDLMKEGMVDQLIGEDGHFYYKLTDEGKKRSKNIPKNIRKFFKNRGKDEM